MSYTIIIRTYSYKYYLQFYAKRPDTAEVEIGDESRKFSLNTWNESPGLAEQGYTDFNTRFVICVYERPTSNIGQHIDIKTTRLDMTRDMSVIIVYEEC